MKRWTVQDAKARFSELLRASMSEGPQMVTLRGAETAVLVPIEEWRRLQGSERRSLKDWLLAPEPRFDLELPDRKQFAMRPPPTLDD